MRSMGVRGQGRWSVCGLCGGGEEVKGVDVRYGMGRCGVGKGVRVGGVEVDVVARRRREIICYCGKGKEVLAAVWGFLRTMADRTIL